MYSLFGYIDIFPPQKVHAGEKCLILGDFHNNANFSLLNGRIVDCKIVSLSTGKIYDKRGMILDFGAWVYGHANHYGIIFTDTELEKGCVVSVDITIPDLGGV